MSEFGADLSSMHQNEGRGTGSLRSKYDGGSTMGLTMGGGDDDLRRSGGGAGADNEEIVSRSQRWEGARSASPMAGASNPFGADTAADNGPFSPSPPAGASGAGEGGYFCGIYNQGAFLVQGPRAFLLVISRPPGLFPLQIPSHLIHCICPRRLGRPPAGA